MKEIKVWPHVGVVAILVALVAGLGTAFYFKHEQNVQAEALPNAARIQRVDGEVALSNSLDANGNQVTDEADAQWVTATPNQPFSVGDRIYTRENSHASLAFTGRNFARLNPNTSLDVLDLSDNRTQLALRDGSGIFDVGYLNSGELYEVGTPNGAVDFLEPGLYNVGYDDNGNVLVSVLSGLAQVVGQGGSGRISKGEILTLAAQAATQAALSRLDGRDAGYVVDDYYRYQYPNVYDGRYNNYDAYLSDPYYYDPYRRDVSYQYAPAFIPGLNDLDSYGDWQDVSGYGHCWRPRVDASWAPYQEGYWVNDYPYGPTWVSSEAWGYAPYHYGRWVNSGSQWFWVPDARNSTPRYSPALVAFVPLNETNEIGWVPLAPGDPYAPRYYDRNWQPYYLTRTDVHPRRVINLDVPGAVTVIPLDRFGRDIDRREIRRFDRQHFAKVGPVLDPLTLAPLRNAAVHSAWGRGKTDLPPGIAKKLHDRQIVVGVAPSAPPFRRDLARLMRVQPVADRVRKQELKIERRDDQSPGQRADNDFARRQQIEKLAPEAARGDRDARQQVRALEQQQQKQQFEQQRAQREVMRQAEQTKRGAQVQQAQRQPRALQQQPQGERVGRPQQPLPQRERVIPKPQPVQPPVERKLERKQMEVRPAPVPRPERRQLPQQSIQRQEMKQQQRQMQVQQQAAPKHESRQQSPQQDRGGGKGKGKKP
ncbi:MAG TPA: DUF6600 domain-containing protein [Pyrinomonadaceae bacterium]|jgi:hypothetical protein|nr:DUF6600 domain-containing protein [Pyrinomonadaceae bacterium]